MTSDIFHVAGAPDLSGLQILDEEAMFGIGPEGAVEIVARADGVDLDAKGDQLQGKRLGEANSPEFSPRIGKILIAAFQSRLGIDLDDVHEMAGIKPVLQFHDRGNIFGTEEIGVVVDAGHQVEGFRGHFIEAAGAENPGVGDEHVDTSEAVYREADHFFHG